MHAVLATTVTLVHGCVERAPCEVVVVPGVFKPVDRAPVLGEKNRDGNFRVVRVRSGDGGFCAGRQEDQR